MSKKTKNKNAKQTLEAIQQQKARKATEQKNHISSITHTPVKKQFLWLLSLFIFLFAFLLNSNTFHHRFVLDDHGIIKNNKITKAPVSMENTKTIFSTSLRKGDFSDLENTLYRPFTKLLFNIEWNLFNGNPGKFHVVNVLLYAILCGFIFMVLYDFFDKKWLLPFFISLIFLVHPIHSEVVANVKSGDEILGMLGIVMALRFIQLYLQNGKAYWVVLIVLSYLVALFSKESAVVGAAIFPIFIYYSQSTKGWSKNVLLSTLLLICAFVFIAARHLVLSQYPKGAPTSAMDNFMVLSKNFVEQFASAVMMLGYYILKFFVPYPLSCDYSYSTFEPVGINNFKFLLPFALLILMAIFAIKEIKNKSKLSFGIIWFFITISIVSNVFFLIGTGFGERLFFTTSLGTAIIFIVLLAKYFLKNDENQGLFASIKNAGIMWTIVLAMVAVYSFITINRNANWRTDYELFSHDIEKYPNSTHLLFYMGNHLSGDERKEVLRSELLPLNFTEQMIADSSAKESKKSVEYLTKSLSIFPALPSDGYNQLGKAYYNSGFLDSAFKYYSKAYALDTTNGIFINNIGTVYYNRAQAQLTSHPDSAMYNMMLSFQYFIKANAKDPKEADFCNNIGCVYGMTNKPDSAIYWFKKASEAEELDITSLRFLEVTYRNKGQITEADYYARQLKIVEQKRLENLPK